MSEKYCQEEKGACDICTFARVDINNFSIVELRTICFKLPKKGGNKSG